MMKISMNCLRKSRQTLSSTMQMKGSLHSTGSARNFGTKEKEKNYFTNEMREKYKFSKFKPKVHPYLEEWSLNGKESVNVEELKDEIENLDPEQDAPFIILDLRDKEQKKSFNLPSKTKVMFFSLISPLEASKGAFIPTISIPFSQVIKMYYHNIPKNKTLICLSNIGARNIMATEALRSEGYAASALEGGMDSLVQIFKDHS